MMRMMTTEIEEAGTRALSEQLREPYIIKHRKNKVLTEKVSKQSNLFLNVNV